MSYSYPFLSTQDDRNTTCVPYFWLFAQVSHFDNLQDPVCHDPFTIGNSRDSDTDNNLPITIPRVGVLPFGLWARQYVYVSRFSLVCRIGQMGRTRGDYLCHDKNDLLVSGIVVTSIKELL